MTRSDYSAHPLQMSAAPGRAAPGLTSCRSSRSTMFSSYQSRLSSASLAYSRLSAVSCVAVLAVVRVNQGDRAWELHIGHFGTEEDEGSFMGGRELAILCFFPWMTESWVDCLYYTITIFIWFVVKPAEY